MKGEYPVTRLCLLLGVVRESYYKWVKNEKPIMNNFNNEIAQLILVEHNELKGTYGTIRLKHHIKIKYGIVLNHKLIRRYKKELGISVNVRKRQPIYLKAAKEKNLANKAPNILGCDFKSDRPLSKLSTDVSYIKCLDGTMYLSAVKDLYNNEILSFSISKKNDLDLVMETYKKIPIAQDNDAIIHSDQGSVYLAYKSIKEIESKGYKRSMSKRGCCWQNSPIENWFSQLKEEMLRNGEKPTMNNASEKIEKYVLWYNTERIQKDLGYLSPVQYKNLHI